MEILNRDYVTSKRRGLEFARKIYIENSRLAQALGLVKQVSMKSFIRRSLLGQINFDTGDLINLINQLLMKAAS